MNSPLKRGRSLFEIIFWQNGGMHYTNLDIYKYTKGEIKQVFSNGSACPVEADFKAEKPIIKIGRANWEQEGWNYASGEPLWQVYVWNGKEFVYDKNLSTTDEIKEDEEVNRFVDKVKGLMDNKKNE
jgi:hypothetical protein